MGLTNKLATKLRTTAKTEPVGLPTPYEDNGAVVAAAVIRAASATIAQLKLSSSGARGSDFLSMRQTRTAQASILWIHQTGLNQWTIALGAHTAGGWAIDWQLDITIENASTGTTVSITTPTVLTRDGTLVNKAAHAELRDLILTGLKAGRLPRDTAETTISEQGLASPALAPIQLIASGSTQTETIRTSLTSSQITAILDRLPYPSTGQGSQTRTWQLGTSGDQATRTVELSIADDGQHRTLTARYVVTPSGRHVSDALGAARANGLIGLLWHRIEEHDPAATKDEMTELPTEATR